MALLRIKNGVEAGTALTLRRGTLRVGRSEGNDYQIADTSVSGGHCEVALDAAGNLAIRDLGSTNGTFVEGQRITEALMKPGQTLRLGNVELAFENTQSVNDAAVVRVEPAEAVLDQHDPVDDLGAMYLVSTPNGEYRAPADAAGHANLSASFARGVILQQRYVLERELGRGAMGQVFLARDIRLTRPVAIKVILATRGGQAKADSSVSQEVQRAFEEEAQVGANLNHPAIATVFDYGFHQGNPFTVFEYIEGETLQQFLHRRKRIPLDEVRLIIAPLAQGLDYAHSHHIVHRDLKPANIRATPQGDFKILDLGLAKRLLQADEQAGFAGTPAYASPEQASGLPVDGRTDQYALALIVYEMITGQRPFQAETPEEMLRLHCEAEVPDPHSLAPDLPEAAEVRAALLRALHKDPDERFASCEALAVALGCQLRSTVAPATGILLEAEVRSRPDFWREAGIARRQHLALLPGAVWCDQGWGIRSWPTQQIVGLKRLGQDLQFALSGSGGGKLRFRFPSVGQCAEWYEGISAQKRLAASESATDVTAVEQSPVVLLRQRPNMRFQLLGQVEADGKRRRTREGALRIRGALLRADAVVGLEEERIPGVGQTLKRTSGTAVRAIDPAGRSELKGQWFSERTSRLTVFMFWLLGASLVVRTFTLFIARSDLGPLSQWLPDGALLQSAPLLPLVAGIAGAHVWPLGLCLLLRGLRWPQLMPAAAITFLTYNAVPLLSLVTLMFAASVTGDWTRAWHTLLLLIAGVEGWSLMFLGFLLGRRIWRTHREFRVAMRKAETSPPAGRVWAGRLALVVSVVIAVVSSVFVVRAGFRLGTAREAGTGTASSLLAAGYKPQTNDLPDIGVSWELNSGWLEDPALAQPGFEHFFNFKHLLFARTRVQETQALPPRLRGDHKRLLLLTQEREFRDLVRPESLGEAQPIQTDGIDWSEMKFKGVVANQPNLEFRFLLRAHADSTRQATVLIFCSSNVWEQLNDMAQAAADGFHLGSFPLARKLVPAPAGTRFGTYKGTRQPYVCRLPGVWQRQAAPPASDPRLIADLLLSRGSDVWFGVLLQDVSLWQEGGFSLQGTEKIELNALQQQTTEFKLLRGEDVEVGTHRGRLLSLFFRKDALAFTLLRALVIHSGWLYHVSAWTTNPKPDLRLLEEALAGIEFPRDSAN